MEWLVLMVIFASIYRLYNPESRESQVNLARKNISLLAELNKEMLKSNKLNSISPLFIDYVNGKINKYSSGIQPDPSVKEELHGNVVYKLKNKLKLRVEKKIYLEDLYRRLALGLELTILISFVAQSHRFKSFDEVILDYKKQVKDIEAERNDVFVTRYDMEREPYVGDWLHIHLHYDFLNDSPIVVLSVIEFLKKNTRYLNPFIITEVNRGVGGSNEYSSLMDRRSSFLNSLLVGMCKSICEK